MLSIALLATYLFNIAGYQFLFSVAIQQSDKQLVQRIDQEQYNNDDLVQIKIPLHLPYYNSQSGYERVNGEVKHQGIYYSYVKRKVSHDTLYILCVKNESKTKLKEAQTDYAKHSTELPSDKQNSSAKKANSLTEHNTQPTLYSFTATEIILHQHHSLSASPLPQSFLATNLQPPDFIA